MLQVRLWLPAASRAEADAAVSQIVRSWAQSWFAEPDKISWSAAPASSLRCQGWYGDGEAMIGCEEGEATLLGAAICAHYADADNAYDQAVLAKVGEESLTDLAGRLGATVNGVSTGSKSATGEWARHCFIVTSGNHEWSLGLVLGDEAMARLRRSRANSGATPKLGRITAALGTESCQLGLHLGHARLEAAELAALVQGDVIALDKPARGDLCLTVEGRQVISGSARIEPSEDSLKIAIVTPPSLFAKELPPI